MEHYLHKVGLYFSLVWIVVLAFQLGIRFLDYVDIEIFFAGTKSFFAPFQSNLIHGLLALVYVVAIPSVLHAVPWEQKRPWGALFASTLLVGFVDWAYDLGYDWVVIGAIARFLGLILTIYAFWKFKKYQPVPQSSH